MIPKWYESGVRYRVMLEAFKWKARENKSSSKSNKKCQKPLQCVGKNQNRVGKFKNFLNYHWKTIFSRFCYFSDTFFRFVMLSDTYGYLSQVFWAFASTFRYMSYYFRYLSVISVLTTLLIFTLRLSFYLFLYYFFIVCT